MYFCARLSFLGEGHISIPVQVGAARARELSAAAKRRRNHTFQLTLKKLQFLYFIGTRSFLETIVSSIFETLTGLKEKERRFPAFNSLPL